ncbi:copper resistance CopC family protein [Microbacterium sp. 2FI]|uniref:copper resistance CopC family protein n=1 Tax=Microbacterium sp. 2FI TaxID=2502193 RepID=UPI0020175112|nr:copper resistance CopC family protein [Microbacterium sp. 2FI]
MPAPRVFRLRSSLALVAVLLLAAVALLVPVSPAAAHDELIGSSPAADSTVDALPAELTLTFSSVIAPDEGASEVQVTDAAGTILTDGAPSASETVLTQPLTGSASGVVTVLWKVVSSDGHPISGEFDFTVTGAPTETATPTPSTEPTATTEPVPTEEPTATATPAPPADEDSTFGDVWPWILGGIVVAGLGGAVLYLLVSRARQQKELAENRERALGGGAAPDSPADSAPPTER